jgi:hypothetical protein
MSRDGVSQVVNYHVGVGVSGGVLDRVYGGISGEGGFAVDFLMCFVSRMIDFDGSDGEWMFCQEIRWMD